MKRIILLLAMLLCAGSIALAQDPPFAYSSYYGIPLYTEDSNPGADSLNYAVFNRLAKAIRYPIANYIDSSKAYTTHIEFYTRRTTALPYKLTQSLYNDSTIWRIDGIDAWKITSEKSLRYLATGSSIPFELYVRNDSTLAWIERDITGDHFTTYLRVRSLGRAESGIYAGLEAVSKGNDTVLVGIYAAADGAVKVYAGGSLRAQFNATGLAIGVPSTSVRLTVSQNTSALPAPFNAATTTLYTVGANGGVNRVAMDAFGGQSLIELRRANGTATSPSAVSSGHVMGQITVYGYGTDAYSTTGRVRIQGIAAENWTNTAQGSYVTIATTAIGSTTLTDRVRIDDTGKTGFSVIPTAMVDILAGDSATARAPFRIRSSGTGPGSLSGGGYLWNTGTYILYQRDNGVWDTLSVVRGSGGTGTFAGWSRYSSAGVYTAFVGDYVHLRLNAGDTTGTKMFTNYSTTDLRGVFNSSADWTVRDTTIFTSSTFTFEFPTRWQADTIASPYIGTTLIDKILTGASHINITGNIATTGAVSGAGGTLTGTTIQTAASPNARVVMSSAGIGTWNSSNVQTSRLYIDGSGWLGANQQFQWSTSGAVSLNIGSGVFQVSSAGALTATSADITGAITASSGEISGSLLVSGALQTAASPNARVVMSSSGIGTWNSSNVQTSRLFTDGSGWLGSSNGLSWTSAGAVTLGTGGSININGGVFQVTSAGVMTATSATITGAVTATSGSFTGTITASSGTISGNLLVTGGLQTAASPNARVVLSSAGIGTWNSSNVQTSRFFTDGSGWLGASNGLSWTSAGAVTLGTGGSININGGVFSVTSAGVLTATSATVTGTMTSDNGSGQTARLYNGTVQIVNDTWGSATFSVSGLKVASLSVGGSSGTLLFGDAFTYAGNTIWHAANDGTGSGLDADLLDGSHASAFAAASHNHSWSNITSGVPTTISGYGITDGMRWRGNLDSAPSSPSYGDHYYDINTYKVYIYTAGGWTVLN